MFCLVHLHLPRTGGTTVRNLLLPHVLNRITPRQVFLVDHGPEHGCRCGSLADFAALERSERDQLRFVSGHMPLWVANWLTDPVIFTVLRSPVERALSDYWYCFHERNSQAHAAARALTPVEFCERGYSQTHNGQARYLSGAVFGNAAPSDSDLHERAMKALHATSYVGRFEHFQQTLNDIAGLAGVGRLNADVRLNTADRLAEVSPEDKSRIAELNRIDEALYATA